MDWLRTFWVCHLILFLFWYQTLLQPIVKFDEEQKWWEKHLVLTFPNTWVFIGNPVDFPQHMGIYWKQLDFPNTYQCVYILLK